MRTLSIILILSLYSLGFAQSNKTRVNFGNMNIKGQTKNADTVYMQNRGQLKQETQIEPRLDYRKEIKRKVFLK